MALINCEECSQEVSDKAEACPKCGAPISGSKDVKAAGIQVKTIQETSKKFKVHSLISVFLIIIGVIILIAAKDNPESSGAAGSMAMMIGFVWYAVNRFRIWWHHK